MEIDTVRSENALSIIESEVAKCSNGRHPRFLIALLCVWRLKFKVSQIDRQFLHNVWEFYLQDLEKHGLELNGFNQRLIGGIICYEVLDEDLLAVWCTRRILPKQHEGSNLVYDLFIPRHEAVEFLTKLAPAYADAVMSAGLIAWEVYRKQRPL